jgi:site-specific DNA-methyltransferase (adenine-specific)
MQEQVVATSTPMQTLTEGVVKVLGIRGVFSGTRTLVQPEFELPNGLILDQPQQMDGMALLSVLADNSVPLVIFDPQYRVLLDRQKYGNEGISRQRERAQLPQMDTGVIQDFVGETARVLMPSGHLFLWTDTYIILGQGVTVFLEGTDLQTVDMIVWNKQRMGMGYRSRQVGEFLVVLQKSPVRAKGIWCDHAVPNVWDEKIVKGRNGELSGIHPKPVGLQQRLIGAVTNPGDIVVDPAAGSYSVLDAAQRAGRRFLGCDLLPVDAVQ